MVNFRGIIGFFSGIKMDIKKNPYLYALGIPGFLFFAFFSYLPMFGHVLAFKKYRLSDGIWGSEWVGLDNFKFFFSGHDWINVTRNTLLLNTLFLFMTTVIAILIAVFLNEIRSEVFKKLAQSVIFLPYFISWMVISLMVFALLNFDAGIINRTLVSLGMDKVEWYQDASKWPAIMSIVYVWKFAGYNSIIYLAAITGIPQEVYESAKVDGATRFQMITGITLPMLAPTVITLVLLGIGRIFFGDFGMFYGIIGDNPALYSTTDVIDTFAYRSLRQLGNFSMSSAIVLYQSMMGLVTICLFNFIVKKINKDYSLF
ncbi:ABC transporter permease [Cellulosilyticum sp. I15G10I2]|uniref:ABC transporter permease n=1 Tax=Cellulosilyticum sp. I15G10I2 TaxID=1892843 RepID=UPI001FA7EA71|nr:ABC transporter permease subunit [Cellulosilyticum sp. I15G10I2]